MESLEKWAMEHATTEQKRALFLDNSEFRKIEEQYDAGITQVNIFEIAARNGISALQAVIPLSGFLLFVLVLVLRERLPQSDKVLLGIILTFFGMALFNIGNEIGLTKLGNQVGSKLPSSFKKIDIVNERTLFTKFDENIVQTSIKPNGKVEKYFFANINNEYLQVPFRKSEYDEVNRVYVYTPTKGPLYGGKTGIAGYLVVLIFGFIMGYGATLAEPALNALGLKVEEITVGTFKKVILMQAVAIGVGLGITFGIVKIITWFNFMRFLGAAATFVLVLFPATENLIWVGLIWIYFFNGQTVFTYILQTAPIDQDEMLFGSRREGMFFGINALFTMPANSIGPIIGAAIMLTFGYNQGADAALQLPSVFTGIKFIFVLLPHVLGLLAILIIRGYPLDNEQLDKIRTSLEKIHEEKKKRIGVNSEPINENTPR